VGEYFVTTTEEEDIPIFIGLDIPSQIGMDLEEALRRFELQEGNPKFPDDANHEQYEMVLDDFQ
ncbi:hypothetical protein KI387_016544, partial [Taxus chinensis]